MIDRLSALAGMDVSRETLARLKRFAELLVAENQRQNLISKRDVDQLWERHILDGAQLVGAAGGTRGSWCDIGSGPGLPGIVVAIITGDPVALVEPRRLRADFMRSAIAELRLDDAEVHQAKIEAVKGKFDIVTARAVAKLGALFEIASHVTHPGTRWVLPKGESVKSELDDAQQTWQGRFRLIPSQTQDGAAIVIADQVRRKGKG
jgi:16S rRNA (guanine527-N7)-methyltransferase